MLSFSFSLFLALVWMTLAAATTTSNNGKLPQALVSLVQTTQSSTNDAQPLTAACLLTSQTLTQAETAHIQQTLMGDTGKTILKEDTSVVLVTPETLAEVASCVMATRGSVVFSPSTWDLQRGGEGLYTTLGPALASIVDRTTAKLTVVVQQESDVALAQKVIGETMESVTSQTLSQAFGGGVEFVTLDQASASTSWANADPVTQGLNVLDASSTTASSKGSPSDWAATAQLWQQSQVWVQNAVATVQAAATRGLVPDFGSLVTAAMVQAQGEFSSAAQGLASSSSTVAALQQQMTLDLQTRLASLTEEQLELQHQASLRDFQTGLSKLLVSPNLAHDMKGVATTCATAFAKAARALVSPQLGEAGTALLSPAVTLYRQAVYEQTSSRLLKARASGKFKPLPRKGVTIGMHWLLPKPFGNDYRQEPWTVHASDDLVYVPGAVKDVAPDSVAQGDWRSKVVPSPVGNDLIYMQ
mmetsp:Transcript_24139/g.50186  ORF Transcript_24139/g.50186 Transcript_24139/m.50186 type:complete len:472 (-) Transcript_24139:117-1532(-)